MASASKYETKVKLPSKGLLYEDIPGEVTLRTMTTNDEKLLYGSTTNIFGKVLQSCIVEPKDISIGDLLPFDEQFLILKLRSHTYGSMYKIQGTCPNCGAKATYDVNLDEMECFYLDDDFKEPITFTLPECEKEVSIKLLRNKDWEAVRRQAKKISKSIGCNTKELEYIIRMSKYIKQIDGEDIDEGKAQSFVEKLSGRDSAFFWWTLDSKVKCGLDTTTTVTCSGCGEEFDLPFIISSEFFRPKFG